MKISKSNQKKCIFIIFTIVAILLLVIYFKFYNDGMNQSGITNVYYKVYGNGKWSNYSKNGMTSGNKKTVIKKIKIKTKSDIPIIEYYQNNKWQSKISKKDKVYALRLISSSSFLKHYDMCYRTYTKSNKWLNWACNSEPSGNTKEPILAIEIKAIPKHVVKSDYLKNYIENSNSVNVGF